MIKKFTEFKNSPSDNLKYHGNRKGDFPPNNRRFAGSIFLTSNLEFAKNFAGFDERDKFPEGSVWEILLKDNLKICDPSDSDTMIKLDLKSIIQKMIDENYVDPISGIKFNRVGRGFKGFNPEKNIEFDIEDEIESVHFYLWRIRNGSWRIIECSPIIDQIKLKKYDGFKVVERGNINMGIFDENSILKYKKIKI
jgi:hypothetical protein